MKEYTLYIYGELKKGFSQMFNCIPRFNFMNMFNCMTGFRFMPNPNFIGSEYFPNGHSLWLNNAAMGIGNPNHISQWNPMLIGCNMNPYGTNTFLSQVGANLGLNQGMSIASTYLNKQYVSQMLNSLGSIKSQISNIKKSGKLDESQKQKLQNVLDEITSLERKIKSLINPSREEVAALQEEVKDLIESAREVAQEIIKEIQEASEDDDEAAEADGSDDVDPETSEEEYTYDDDAIDIACNIFKSVDGVNFTKTDLKTALENSKLTNDNIVDVFAYWEETFASTEGHLIERVFGDIWEYNGLQTEILELAKKFENKAKTLGIYAKVKGQLSVIQSEMNATFNTDEQKVSNAFQEVFEIVKKAQDKKVKTTKKKEKADEAKRKKEQEAKNTFLGDMRSILQEENAEMSKDIKYDNGKFSIRINGKTYYGKDYNDLAKKLEKERLKPKEYLIKKEGLNVAA